MNKHEFRKRFASWPVHLRMEAAVEVVEQLCYSPTEREGVITMLARLSDLGPAEMDLLTPDYEAEFGSLCEKRDNLRRQRDELKEEIRQLTERA